MFATDMGYYMPASDWLSAVRRKMLASEPPKNAKLAKIENELVIQVLPEDIEIYKKEDGFYVLKSDVLGWKNWKDFRWCFRGL